MDQFIRLLRGSPNVRLMVIVALGLIVLVIVARIIANGRADAVARKGGAARSRKLRSDAWSMATTFASAGDYTAACHALYAGVVDTLAAEGALTRHASKTSGDYSSELRGRAAVRAREFRSFAADFDRVIYGVGSATESDYLRLRVAAEQVLDRSGGERVAA